MMHTNELNPFKFSPATWIIPTLLVLGMWLVFYVDHSFHLDLMTHGILPRTFFGLQGVAISPFLHADLSHIANNSLPIFVLTMALLYFYREISLKVVAYGILLSGLITWVIGRDAYHIGASGLIYVLVSFIFFKGLMTKYYRLMALSFAVVILYGGMIWYVFPEVDKTISWEGHLAGFLTGFVFAVQFKTPDYVKEIQFPWEHPNFNPDEDDFMKRFDENGNFVNPPKPEVSEETPDEVISQPIRYVYVLKENPKEE